MLTKSVVIVACILGCVYGVDWKTITCDQLYNLGVGTFQDFCDLETALDVVCAKRKDDSEGRSFDSECHMKIANCQADFHRKGSSSSNIPKFAQRYTKISNSQCSDYNQKYCEKKTKNSCKSTKTNQVCGSDGITYDNDCALETAKCVASKERRRQPYKTRSSACPGVVG